MRMILAEWPKKDKRRKIAAVAADRQEKSVDNNLHTKRSSSQFISWDQIRMYDKSNIYTLQPKRISVQKETEKDAKYAHQRQSKMHQQNNIICVRHNMSETAAWSNVRFILRNQVNQARLMAVLFYVDRDWW